ncbi:MAG: sulfite exporter TauE/SafE family protein [Pseudohongiellaceae bacterium]
MPFDFGYIIAGFIVGWLVGLTGVGGGSLMTPILLLLFNVNAAVAVGTDLLYAAITKTVGIFAHGKLGNIDWRIVGSLAAGSVPVSFITTLYLADMDLESGTLVDQIKFWLGIALLVTSLSVLFRNELLKSSGHKRRLSSRTVTILTLLLGMILGFLVTLTSVGAGALGVTALLLLYPNVHINRIVGTDVAHAVPLTLVAGLGHASLGTVDYGLLGTLLIGSIPGIWIGSHMTGVVGEHWVRNVLALILVYVGQKLAFPELNQLLGLGILLSVVVLKFIIDNRKLKPVVVEE